jgi:type I restriction enzyme S subunit
MIQLRHVFEIVSGSTPESGNPDYWDGDIAWVTPEDVSQTEGGVLRDTRRKLTLKGFANSGAMMAGTGGIVLTKRAPIGQLAMLGIDACSNQGCFLLSAKSGVEPRFFFYVLANSVPLLQALGRGSTFMELSTDDLKSLRVPVPLLHTQVATADFLDRETARLDALVAAKQRQLDLLAEKRRAVIATAVTRGPDSKVKLRDSGVPWLGEIPGHWPLVPLRYLVSFLSGGTPDKGNADFWSGGTIPWVSPKDMKVEVIDDSEDHITEAAVDGSATRIVPVGSVLVVVRGMILAHSLPVAVTSAPVTINQDIKALVCGERLLPDFLRIVLEGQSRLLLSLADSSAHGTKKLETEVLQRLEVPAPALDEQRAIVDHIARETAKLDALRAATERTIVLLKGRRTALIAAAVTGQINVVETA